MIKAGSSEGSRPQGENKVALALLPAFVMYVRGPGKMKGLDADRQMLVGTGEGSNPSITTPFPCNPGRCSGTN